MYHNQSYTKRHRTYRFFYPGWSQETSGNPERKLLIKDFQFNLSPPTWKKSLKKHEIYGNIWEYMECVVKTKVFKPQEEDTCAGTV